MKKTYRSNPSPIRAHKRKVYRSNPSPVKIKSKLAYHKDCEHNKIINYKRIRNYNLLHKNLLDKCNV